MAKPVREVVFAVEGSDDVEVAALWYGEESNVWRVEIRANDLHGDLTNMTIDETRALAESLLKACMPWRFPGRILPT